MKQSKSEKYPAGFSRRKAEDERIERFFDVITAVIPVVITAIGIITVYIVTRVTQISDCGGISKVIVQICAAFIGIAGMIFLYRFPANKKIRLNTKYLWIVCLIISLGILAVTYVAGSGPNGIRSWIKIKGLPFSIQTSEFVKLFFIVSFSGHIRLLGDKINRPLAVLSLLAHTGVICGMVVLLGDLGSAVVFFFIALAVCFVSGLSIFYYLGGLALCGAAAPILWSFLSDYQQKRIAVGFNPELDPLGYGYQVIISKDAVINGGITGNFLLSLRYSQILPASHSDMIFAVYSEQFGLAGAVILFVLYFILILMLLRITHRSSGITRTVSMGFASVLIFQITENIGMCLGLMPVIGITLPFMSYGGSSLVSLFFGIGMILYLKNRSA